MQNTRAVDEEKAALEVTVADLDSLFEKDILEYIKTQTELFLAMAGGISSGDTDAFMSRLWDQIRKNYETWFTSPPQSDRSILYWREVSDKHKFSGNYVADRFIK